MRGVTVYIHDVVFDNSISIHTPHAGSDEVDFENVVDGTQIISIHTPHAGSDGYTDGNRGGNMDFNPHSPCGE